MITNFSAVEVSLTTNFNEVEVSLTTILDEVDVSLTTNLNDVEVSLTTNLIDMDVIDLQPQLSCLLSCLLSWNKCKRNKFWQFTRHLFILKVAYLLKPAVRYLHTNPYIPFSLSRSAITPVIIIRRNEQSESKSEISDISFNTSCPQGIAAT